MDDSLDSVNNFLDNTGITYVNLFDYKNKENEATTDKNLSDKFGIVGLPTTVFINSKGLINHIHVGELSKALLSERIDLLIAER